MAKMTREQKQAQRDADCAAHEAKLRAEKIAAFRRRVELERTQVTVEKAWDVMKLGETVSSPLFGQNATVELLYTALEAAFDARKEYERQLEYLRERVVRAQAELAEGYSYSSLPVQSRGNETDAAHATYITAVKLAYAVVRSVRVVYVPALSGQRQREQRAERLRYFVTSTDAGWSLLDTNADVPAAIATTGHNGVYETEEAAWMAFMALVGEW
jgi:hypothetical protein